MTYKEEPKVILYKGKEYTPAEYWEMFRELFVAELTKPAGSNENGFNSK